MTRDDGGPAFPVPGRTENLSWGMSLRDWFAGMAMLSVLKTAAYDGFKKDYPVSKVREDVAAGAYLMADAMLAERKKEAKDDPS